MNDWIGLTIDTSNEAEEAVANFLMEAGAVGIQIEDDTTDKRVGAAVTGFFATSTNLVELQANLTAKIAQLPGFGLDPGTGKISVKDALQADWANKWKQYYQPLRVSRYLTVVPEWLDYTPSQTGEIVLRLDPDMAFGTGAHPTTALMLQLLEAEIRGGERMIDVGTGSGILAIAARRLGVATVLATDVDDVAVDNAEANLALNPVDQITVIANDLLTGIDTQADIICANILAEVLLPLIPQLPKRLAEDGIVLLSGIFHDKEAAIRQALAKAGLTVIEARHRGDWVALVAKEVRA